MKPLNFVFSFLSMFAVSSLFFIGTPVWAEDKDTASSTQETVSAGEEPVVEEAVAKDKEQLTSEAKASSEAKPIDNLDEAIKKDPKSGQAYLDRGNAYFAAKEYQKAIDDFTKGLELDDKNAMTYYYNRGNAYLQLNQQEKAIADYDKVIELDPEMYQAYVNRALVYSDMHQYPKAIADFNKAENLKTDHQKIYALRA